MKKLVLAVATAFVISSTASMAGTVREECGCGLGGLAMGDTEATMLMAFAGTLLNGLCGNQTFGITSGTLDCDQAMIDSACTPRCKSTSTASSRRVTSRRLKSSTTLAPYSAAKRVFSFFEGYGLAFQSVSLFLSPPAAGRSPGRFLPSPSLPRRRRLRLGVGVRRCAGAKVERLACADGELVSRTHQAVVHTSLSSWKTPSVPLRRFRRKGGG